MRVERRKSQLGRDSILVNLATCNLGMIAAAAGAEASLLGPLNVLVFVLFVNLAFLGYLLDATAYGAVVEAGAPDASGLSDYGGRPVRDPALEAQYTESGGWVQ